MCIFALHLAEERRNSLILSFVSLSEFACATSVSNKTTCSTHLSPNEIESILPQSLHQFAIVEKLLCQRPCSMRGISHKSIGGEKAPTNYLFSPSGQESKIIFLQSF